MQELPCHHEFHADCISLWLRGSNTCPICRLALPEALEEEDSGSDCAEIAADLARCEAIQVGGVRPL